MNELQVFNHKDFGGIRALEIDGQPWFVGKDISDVLKYKNGSRDINRHVDAEDRQNYQNGTSEINNRGITIVNISGVYSLILSSKLPKAREFRHWVTSVVLPTISKTGSYIHNGELDCLIKTVVTQTTAAIMELLPGIILNTVKPLLNSVPEAETAQPKMNALDWNEIAYWEGLLTEWREFRNNYSNKEQADNDFIVNYREKYPNSNIGRRTLYRKWRELTERGSAGLIDKRGRHGNHRRKIVVTVELDGDGDAFVNAGDAR